MSDTRTARNVAAWLETLSGISHVKPVTLDIKGARYYGATYMRTSHYTSSMRAVISGEHKAGDIYLESFAYFVGNTPPCWNKRRKTVFVLKDTATAEWYVAAHSTSNCVDPVYPPFGPSFILAPWNVPGGGAIDQYEDRPYTRVPASLASMDQY